MGITFSFSVTSQIRYHIYGIEWQVKVYRNRFYGRNRKKSEEEGNFGRNGKRLLSWSKLDCIARGVNKKVKGVKDCKRVAYYYDVFCH
jgi:hypothetical protein